MQISLITDEVSSDPETAIELGIDWGVRDFELRGFYTDRVPMLSAYQRQRLHDMLEQYGARVIAVSPGLFKTPFPAPNALRTSLGWMDRPAFESWEQTWQVLRYHRDELLPATLDFAAEFNAKLVIIFSFSRGGVPPGDPPDAVIECLQQAAERASAAEMELAIETEEGFWADTGERSAHLVRAVGHSALGINWDPGNSFCAGDRPYPDGYAHVRGLVRHVHFKDARREPSGEAVYAIDGEVDWPGQLVALVDDGYRGHVSIETHLRPKVATAYASLKRLRDLLGRAEKLAAGLVT